MKIEIDSTTGFVAIDGVEVSFEVLGTIINGSSSLVYQFQRLHQSSGDIVKVKRWLTGDLSFPEGNGPLTEVAEE